MPPVRALGLPLSILALVLMLPAAHAAERCPQFFADSRPPLLTNPKLDRGTIPLCFGAFTVLYSSISRTPIYAAERLTRAGVMAAREVDRADAFHEETRLPVDARSTLEDYLRSGYDRGHMAPAGDMPTPDMQAESFSLANIIPQNRTANRSIWAAIEESVRRLALRRGEVFVVTGTIFAGRSINSLDGRVLVPTQLFKAVYDPRRGEGGAYLASNDEDGEWKPVSLAVLKDAAGIDVFMEVSAAVKATAMSLPEPRTFSRGGGRQGREDDTFAGWMRNELHKVLRRMWRDLMRSVF